MARFRLLPLLLPIVFTTSCVLGYRVSLSIDRPHHKITWPRKYHIVGEKLYLTKGVAVPFELWYRKDLSAARRDTYGGTVKEFYYYDDILKDRTYHIHPETDSVLSVHTKCFYKETEPEDLSRRNDFLPPLENLIYKGDDVVNNIKVSVWTWTDHSDKITIEYELYVKRVGGAYVPVRYIEKEYFSESLHNFVITNFISFDTKVTKRDVDAGSVYADLKQCDDISWMTKNDNEDFEIEKIFHGYKTVYGKSYVYQEHEIRKEIFKANLRYIEEHNKNDSHGYKLAVNKFTDRSRKELASSSCLLPLLDTDDDMGSEPNDEDLEEIAKQAPEQFDLRLKGLVSHIQDQGDCGSCWAFAAASVTETAIALKTGNLDDLSEQSLVDCSWGYDNSGCHGGRACRSFDFIIKYGIPTEQSYGTYLMEDGICHLRNVTSPHIHKIKSYTRVAGTSAALRGAIFKYGAVAVNVYASTTMKMYSGQGIYYDKNCEKQEVNHAVTIVGYGTTGKENYWIVKNSWGATWGMNGYMLLKDEGTSCGALKWAYYVTA